MWKQLKPALAVASIGLNVAVVGVWLAHAVGRSVESPMPAGSTDAVGEVWCPLHRELNVTPEQWAEIEPRLLAFRGSADEQWGRIDALRTEMIDLFAAPEPDREAIAAKQQEILAAKRAMQVLVTDHLLDVRARLDPEQQQRLFAMLRERTACARLGPMAGDRAEGGLGRALHGRGRIEERGATDGHR